MCFNVLWLLGGGVRARLSGGLPAFGTKWCQPQIAQAVLKGRRLQQWPALACLGLLSRTRSKCHASAPWPKNFFPRPAYEERPYTTGPPRPSGIKATREVLGPSGRLLSGMPMRSRSKAKNGTNPHSEMHRAPCIFPACFWSSSIAWTCVVCCTPN